ncbi:MAG TPA: mycothiol conjugate amidase Mca [Acidimicrobiales bacterium]|jgi:mycothiol S-conjugate amidase|nr:mycothiol conjugate amidase Mca [Acidimicrobiales bacterium]
MSDTPPDPTTTFPAAPLIAVDEVDPGPSGRLRIVSVHAHPDDEASKGAGTIAKLTDGGARAVLVTCTGGEAGDVLNPAMDRPEVKADLANVRRDELARAAGVIGYHQVVMLGYRDSGMPDSEHNAHPRAFANAPFDEAVDRLASVLRVVRPHIVLTYADDQKWYPHPDHLRVHDISAPAIEVAAGPATHLPGDPWQVSKVYYSSWSRSRIEAFHEKFLELGLESPYDDRWFERPSQDQRITTRLDVAGYYARRKAALVAHATQIDPTSKFWFGLPDDVAEAAYPWEDWILASSEVPTETPEHDLAAGLHDLVGGEA